MDSELKDELNVLNCDVNVRQLHHQPEWKPVAGPQKERSSEPCRLDPGPSQVYFLSESGE